MAKDRIISCIHYQFEGSCGLGKEASFWRHCQICKTYRPVPGGKPIREDLRQEKKEKINKKEMKDWK